MEKQAPPPPGEVRHVRLRPPRHAGAVSRVRHGCGGHERRMRQQALNLLTALSLLFAVFMTTENKPTAATQYPSMGSITSRLLKTEVGVPPYVTFGDTRNGTVGLAGYLGTGYNPFVIEGDGGNGKTAGGFSVRGLTPSDRASSSNGSGSANRTSRTSCARCTRSARWSR